jgi:xanthine dehydrogenase accessory factor
MLEFKEHLSEWSKSDKIAIARVIGTWGSSPRPVGSALIIDEDFNMFGSVSGGCVEGSVLKQAKRLMETGGGKILSYGVTNEDAWSVGLSCGGKLDVYLQILEKDDFRKELFNKIAQNETVVWNTVIENTDVVQNTISNTTTNEANVFSHEIRRKSQMIIIGAAHISSALIHLAKFYEFETIVIDPRTTFAEQVNFDVAPDQIHNDYPSEVLGDYKLDNETYAVILSHDPKIDDNALQILLKKEVAYIGALGSKKTHAKRVQRLLDEGFSQEQVDRIHAPIGMGINSRTPKEIALSIMAEIIFVKNSVAEK